MRTLAVGHGRFELNNAFLSQWLAKAGDGQRIWLHDNSERKPLAWVNTSCKRCHASAVILSPVGVCLGCWV